MSYSVVEFTESGIARYLEWLNFENCLSFENIDETPWPVEDSFEILLSLQESRSSLLRDFFFCGRLRVVSERAKAIIGRMDPNVQFVRVNIDRNDGPALHYYAMHIMSIRDLVDREKSDFATIKYGMVAGITSLKLKNYPDGDICYLKDTFESIVLVSSNLRKNIEDAELTGLTFIDLNDYIEDTRRFDRFGG